MQECYYDDMDNKGELTLYLVNLCIWEFLLPLPMLFAGDLFWGVMAGIFTLLLITAMFLLRLTHII